MDIPPLRQDFLARRDHRPIPLETRRPECPGAHPTHGRDRGKKLASSPQSTHWQGQHPAQCSCSSPRPTPTLHPPGTPAPIPSRKGSGRCGACAGWRPRFFSSPPRFSPPPRGKSLNGPGSALSPPSPKRPWSAPSPTGSRSPPFSAGPWVCRFPTPPSFPATKSASRGPLAVSFPPTFSPPRPPPSA